MKKFINCYLPLVIILCGLADAFAQNSANQSKLNFSGTWMMDNKKSAFYFLGQKMPDSSNCESTLIITQTDTIITMNYSGLCKGKGSSATQTKESKSEKKYFTDKRGEINLNVLKDLIYSETEIKKKSLLIKEYKRDSKGKKGQLLTKTEYRLSEDGKTLNVRNDIYTNDFLNMVNPAGQYSLNVYKLKN